PVEYRGHQVLRLTIQSAEELARTRAVAARYSLDVWTPWRIGHIDIRLAPEQAAPFHQLVDAPYTTLIADLQTLVDQQQQQQQPSSSISPASSVATMDAPVDGRNATHITDAFFKSYQGFEELAALCTELADVFPRWVERIRIGLSHEGRELFGVRIHARRSNSTVEQRRKSKRREIVIAAGAHGREWISTAVASYLAYALATGYAINPHIASLVDRFEFTILPLLNPDGYMYARDVDRMWRKNRQPIANSSCVGTDDHWNADGQASYPCSENYPGSEPFSAPETRQLADYLKERDQAIAFIDLHAYSQLWMLPFSAQCRQIPRNKENMLEMALGAVESIRRVNGTRFEVGSVCNIMYRQSGTAIDWIHRHAHALFSFWIELRDTGTYGFMLPPEYILPSGEEMLAGVLHVGDFI
ncbi:hypothetical protein SYNPS1DRAFT_2973, partial [Syncephalis pseudoplumigaleata]